MAVDSSIDLELQLKKRARRRLVGAIALVLLMIIVLPVVLHDRSVDQPKQEVTITIPNEAVAPQKSRVTADVNEQTAKPVDDLTVINEHKQTAIVDGGTSVTNSENKTTNSKSAEKITEEKKSVAATKAEPENSIATNAKFYVQIGVFSDADNVKKLQSKLSELGYQSQTEKISTDKGEKIRLRTSTFKERNEAAIALENIKSSGMTGIVVSKK